MIITRSLGLILASLLASLGACETADPSLAVVDNAYPLPADPGLQTSVFKGWWSVTEFADPVAAASSSDDQRVIPASDYAYLLLAPNWDPASGSPPSQLIPVRSKEKLSVQRGDRLHIVASDAALTGNCSAGTPLAQDEADFITQRIFPGDFAGLSYHAATCTVTQDTDGGTTPSALGTSVDASVGRALDAAH
ncbi:MAG: hypothetical protein JWN04_6052 [Myxococcaceae bacterium]|nr:hypothetical protein [Myxococcaceae bacterium]